MAEYLGKVKKIKFMDRGGNPVEMIGLFPVDKSQQEKLRTVKNGEILNVSFKRFRSKNHLDQAHAVALFLYENWREKGHYPTINVFRDYLSLEVGFSYPVYRGGNTIDIPETWSYKIDQAEFMERLYNPLMEFAINYLQYKDREQLIKDSIESSLNR